MFDSHCHLHDRRIADPEPLIARARAAGVGGFLLAGVEPAGWALERELRRGHPEIAIAFGVHPQLVAELDDARTDELVAALEPALADGEACAVGEIGLDGASKEGRKPSLARQERAFRSQLAVARARELPVVLHVLDAHGRALEILRADGVPRAGGVLHSCSAPAELIADYLALGFDISFAGTVCNPNAKKTLRAAAAVPLDRLLVETDAPFQTPLPHRPAQNEPAFLVAIVSALAHIRGVSADELARVTAANARRRLGL
jgi:TatD DNase family protein